MDGPLRFDLQVVTPSDVGTVAAAAEDVGYTGLQVPDHLGGPDPFVTLAAAASMTSSLRLGTYVLNNEFWPVALTARATANLDVVSGGRAELGIGAGHMRSEFDAAGWTFHPAGRRVARLEQDVRLLRRLLDGEAVTADGDGTVLRAHRQSPAPVQAHVPLLIGGNGDRVLRLAAEVADVVSLVGFRHRPNSDEVDLSHFDRAGLGDRLAVVRAAAGDRLPELGVNVLIQHVELAGTPQEAAERASGGWADGAISPAAVAASPFVLAGTPSSVAEDLLQLREEAGVTSVTVREPPGSPFDRVVAQLAVA